MTGKDHLLNIDCIDKPQWFIELFWNAQVSDLVLKLHAPIYKVILLESTILLVIPYKDELLFKDNIFIVLVEDCFNEAVAIVFLLKHLFSFFISLEELAVKWYLIVFKVTSPVFGLE